MAQDLPELSFIERERNIQLENYTSMRSYRTQIVEAGQKLKKTSCDTSDEWIASIILSGLSEKCISMIRAMYHDAIPITTDAIRS